MVSNVLNMFSLKMFELLEDVKDLPLGTGFRLRVSKAGPGLVLLARTLAESRQVPLSKATWQISAAITGDDGLFDL